MTFFKSIFIKLISSCWWLYRLKVIVNIALIKLCGDLHQLFLIFPPKTIITSISYSKYKAKRLRND